MNEGIGWRGGGGLGRVQCKSTYNGASYKGRDQVEVMLMGGNRV
jgi:hypothetical protein